MVAWILDIISFLQQKRGEYPAIHIDRTLSSEDLLYNQKNTFFLCNKTGNSHRAKEAHIASQKAANQSRKVASSCLKPPGGTPGNSWLGDLLPGSPNPGPISNQKMSLFTPIF